jgi:chorismate lyase / 3-hydroxybenzoate synthase
MRKGNTLLFGGSFSASEFLQANRQKNGLGALCFTANGEVAQAINVQSKIPFLHVPMQSLGNDDAICECWNSQGLSIIGSIGDLHYQYDNDVLFGVIQMSETAFQTVTNQTPLQQATESAYCQIFSLIEQLQFPHIFRFWNYIADINVVSDQLERYRQFNIGRYNAFLAAQRETTGNVPVACALGSSPSEQDTLSIAFLAGRVQPVAIENPRQISAYQYPEQYGPVSPTFSRAALVELKQSQLLLISGTASIVGHATQHSADAVVQAREAMTNIETILVQANALTSHAKFALADLHYRVYVRHPAHLKDIHDALIRYVGVLPKVEYLQADICRQDLLLEIEASAECPSALPILVKG